MLTHSFLWLEITNKFNTMVRGAQIGTLFIVMFEVMWVVL